MIRLLAVDIDGTLLDSHGRIPPANREALGEAVTRGVHVALVTGRSFHFTLPIASQLQLPLTLVVNNGALVKAPDGTTEMRRLLPQAVARAVLVGTTDFEESVAIVFDRPDERQIVFERMDWAHPNRRGYFEKNRAFIAPAAPLLDALTEDPIQVMFNGGVEPMRKLVTSLKSMRDADGFSVAITEYPQRDFALVDVTAAGCSKGSTLSRWVGERGWHPRDVMAAGDNLNDVEMLEFAGTQVLMGNASAALKTMFPAAHVTGTNDEEGLATAIRSIVLDLGPR
jgi:hypothetical protein